MATLIAIDGTETAVKPARGKKFTLDELQRFVGGSIERVRTRDGRFMYANEDGVGLNLAANDKATALAAVGVLILPPGIRGPVIVMERGEG